ncbi:TetR/AcrR family transcriptional regulator [Clostridium sp.]|uniref:TetR/AcrR family transcriptional regulator n=1 Tax=Clostridium sp. TaxID=1506 RepID=UPI002634E6F4|nr:TetR/AcrR family transcriptional regulator [Clostridium sp.]
MSKTKKAIFEAAINVFATSGYNGSTVDEIASKANLAKGTLYYNFNSKEDIFNFVVENGVKIWNDKLKEIEQSKKEPIDKIKNLCGMQFKLLYDNKSFFKLVISQLWGKETRQDELRNKISEYIGGIERILNEAMVKKQIRECDTSLLAHSLFGSLLSASLYELSVDKELDVDRIIEELTKNTLRGIVIK